MVKVTTVLAASFLIVAPVLAFSNEDFSTRDLAEPDTYERDLSDVIYERGLFDARAFSSVDLEELDARAPFFRKVFGGVKRLIFGRGVEPEDLSQREVDELVQELAARDPFFRKVFGGVKRLIFGRGEGADVEELSEREYEELEELAARDPFFRKIFGGVKRLIFGRGEDEDVEELSEREYEELEELAARDPVFRIGPTLKGFRLREFEEELDAREVDINELD